MQTLFQKINKLNGLIVDGRALEGFEKFYHDEVIMHENKGVTKESFVVD
jgi:hypothetical protein